MKRSWSTAFATAVLVTLAVGASGCLISYDPGSVEVEPFLPGDTTPRIIVVSPKPAEQFSGELPIQLEARNLTLVAPTGQANADGQGHLRVYIDEVCLDDPANPGPGATSFCPEPRAITTTSFSVDISGLEAGTHRLQVEVRANDGSAFTYTGSDGGTVELRPVIVDFEKL